MLSAAEVERREDFAGFLERDLHKDLLRFTTAGSVDDGKSTLIGRLLHDTRAVYEDQLASVRKSRINRSGRAIDFSLLTDGLRAEREQGITIDVAYRYFSTARRKFIIADTPGHEQYTRNMATGASTADLAVILVDGSKGLLEQTRRHTYISALLGIPHVVAAINKMDLVGYREDVFLELSRDFRELAQSLGIASVRCIPISALEGDNVVQRGENTPWYRGQTLMEHLETVEIPAPRGSDELRFSVQNVIRPDAAFRGFAGRISSGAIRPGDGILALPSRRETRVRAIVTYDGRLDLAVSGQSVVLELEDEIDLSRGDMLVSPAAPPAVSDRFRASLVWLDAEPLELPRGYLIKHSGRLVKARASGLPLRVDIHSLAEHPAERLQMNEIASVEFEVSSPLFFDPYDRNRATGSFLLIDPMSNATVGAGMIRERVAEPEGRQGPVTARERIERQGHHPGVFAVHGGNEPAERLERALFREGFSVLLVRQERVPPASLPAVLHALRSAAVLVVYAGMLSRREREQLAATAEDRYFEFPVPQTPGEADEQIHRALVLAAALRSGDRSREGSQ
jgi:sulfate adenylyltransferase large subunit